MSLEILANVWDLDLDRNHKDVLEVLAWHANADGVCWPSKARIMYRTGLSESTVKRTMSSLKKMGLVTVKSHGKGGRGNPNVYVVHPEKGTKKPPFEEWKKGLSVTPIEDKGGQGEHVKGVTALTPEPTIEPTTTTTEENDQEESDPCPVQIDDDTARSLSVLKKVKGFPRNQAENAVYLSELREQFPFVDPVEVCRQYEVWHRDNPGKTKCFRSRLRNFFSKAHDQSFSNRVVPFKKPAPFTGSPSCVVQAFRDHAVLSRYVNVALDWDFTQHVNPEGRNYMRMGGDDYERSTNIDRAKSVARRAMKKEEAG